MIWSQLKHQSIIQLKNGKKTWMSRINGKAYFISALKKDKIDYLKKNIFKEIKKIHINRYPYNNDSLKVKN